MYKDQIIDDLKSVVFKLAQKTRVGGWAPGDYTCTCFMCNTQFAGDKRATQCVSCAVDNVVQLRTPMARRCVGGPLHGCDMVMPVDEEAYTFGSNTVYVRFGLLWLTPIHWTSERAYEEIKSLPRLTHPLT